MVSRLDVHMKIVKLLKIWMYEYMYECIFCDANII